MNTCDILTNLVINASLSEIRAWIKPGNVHRTHDFPNTTYQDFLNATMSLKNNWQQLCNTVQNYNPNSLNHQLKNQENSSLSQIYTEFLINSVQKMMAVQSGGNVLLGHLLILTPLFISATSTLAEPNPSKKRFWEICKQVISDSHYEDTIRLYTAIRSANPGGMGKVEKYDLYNDKVFDEIQKDNMNLQKIFEFSSSRDALSELLSNNYRFIRMEILPRIEKLFEDYEFSFSNHIQNLSKELIPQDIIDIDRNWNEFIIRIFLFILGSKEDSLILRKSNKEQAQNISKRSMELYDLFFMMDRTTWFEELRKFDDELQKSNGQLNPGTTADILAASLFLFYLFSLYNFKK